MQLRECAEIALCGIVTTAFPFSMGYGSDMGNLYARPKRIEGNVRRVIALWGGIALLRPPRRDGMSSLVRGSSEEEDDVTRGLGDWPSA